MFVLSVQSPEGAEAKDATKVTKQEKPAPKPEPKAKKPAAKVIALFSYFLSLSL
uniref:Uncharacterized protein n=1 Tax=Sinocyclocheilus grahami TaxID=75366 RepID=A0A672NC87_SINGR